jgi:hypothetical protein
MGPAQLVTVDFYDSEYETVQRTKFICEPERDEQEVQVLVNDIVLNFLLMMDSVGI